MICPGLGRPCGIELPDDGRRLCHFDRKTLALLGQIVAGEEELGPQRYCRACAFWWPMDLEFWRPIGRRDRPNTIACRACDRTTNRRAFERRTAAA